MLLSVMHPRAVHSSQRGASAEQVSFVAWAAPGCDGGQMHVRPGNQTVLLENTCVHFPSRIYSPFTHHHVGCFAVFFLNSQNVHSEYNVLKCGVSDGRRGSAFTPSGHDTGAESVSPGWQGRCPGGCDRPQAFPGTDGVLSACFGRLPRDPLCPCAGHLLLKLHFPPAPIKVTFSCSGLVRPAHQDMAARERWLSLTDLREGTQPTRHHHAGRAGGPVDRGFTVVFKGRNG